MKAVIKRLLSRKMYTEKESRDEMWSAQTGILMFFFRRERCKLGTAPVAVVSLALLALGTIHPSVSPCPLPLWNLRSHLVFLVAITLNVGISI